MWVVHDWVHKTKHEIQNVYYDKKSEIYSEFNILLQYGDLSDKDFYELVNRTVKKELHSYMFSLRVGDDKNVDERVWKSSKPEFKKAFQ